jgi:HAD superfamily hydrolase (TIGR01549 family)
MENNIKLVIFDLDGTLVHLPVDYSRLRREISRILGISKMNSILEVLSNINDDAKKKIFDIWDNLELEALSNMRESAEGIKIYNKFHGKIKCLVTLQGKRVVEKIIKKMGLVFDHIVTREISLVRSEQIRMIVEKFGFDPKNILVIGDKESDKKAAEVVGCKFMLVRNGTKNFDWR